MKHCGRVAWLREMLKMSTRTSDIWSVQALRTWPGCLVQRLFVLLASLVRNQHVGWLWVKQTLNLHGWSHLQLKKSFSVPRLQASYSSRSASLALALALLLFIWMKIKKQSCTDYKSKAHRAKKIKINPGSQMCKTTLAQLRKQSVIKLNILPLLNFKIASTESI